MSDPADPRQTMETMLEAMESCVVTLALMRTLTVDAELDDEQIEVTIEESRTLVNYCLHHWADLLPVATAFREEVQALMERAAAEAQAEGS